MTSLWFGSRQHRLHLFFATCPRTEIFSATVRSAAGCFMAGTSPPPRDQSFRIGALTGFLPLSDELVSTRGQKLPKLIQSRSVASFSKYQARRPSSIKIDGHDGHEDGESDADEFARQRAGGRSPALRRLMSVGAEVLNTPQMRSMRLIGNSNPRYQW